MNTSFPTIKKPSPDKMEVRPNLDYDRLAANFSWDDMYGKLDWLPGGRLNMAHEAIDRHSNGRLRDKTAIIWEGKKGELEKYSFGDLKTQSNKFGNILKTLGIQKGDRVFLFMDRIPELYVAFFGILKVGAIVCPLISAYGPDPVRDRLRDSGGKIIVTQPNLRRRISGILHELFDLQHIIVVNKGNRDPGPVDHPDLSYEEEMGKASANLEIAAMSQSDYSLIHYTPGATGEAVGAVHRHQAVAQHYATGKWVLDLHDDDVYWCTADPGSATAMSYGILAPLANGVTQLVYEGAVRADSWYEMIQKHRVTVWYTAPTAIRILMNEGDEARNGYDLSSLRHLCSGGEPLDREAVEWGLKAFGAPFHDTWSHAETGAILVANYPAMDIRPGSIGRPIPGLEVSILDDDCDPVPHGSEGELAIRPGWPSMFQNYWNKPEIYDGCFRKRWYLTRERALEDEDGYIWFLGRADDVINVAGHLVGPLEVETALAEHPAVAESAVVGRPGPIAMMEIVKAFVALKDGYEPTSSLRNEILRFARLKLSAAVAPREIEFVSSLPKDKNGAVLRGELKDRETGPPP